MFFMYFNFDSPIYLLLLLLLPCFFYCKQYTQRYYFPKTSWLSTQKAWLSWESYLKIAIFSLMIIALAKPFMYDTKTTHTKKGRDLILAIDASGSMGQSGFNPQDRFKTKFETNIILASDFIKNRHDDNMGIVLFGTFAYTTSPLTYDLHTLSYLLSMTNVGIAGESTAIGDAIMQSMRTLSFGEAKNKAIVLLTDGFHNAGQSSPKEAVKEAKKHGIKIYTIGIGKEHDYDTALLKKIAKETGAKSYAATSAKELSEIYKDIHLLEPSPIRSENYLNKTLLILLPLSIVFVILLFWTLWLQREEEKGEA